MRSYSIAILLTLALALSPSARAAEEYVRSGCQLPFNDKPRLLVVFASLQDFAYDEKGQQIRSPAWEAAAEASLADYLSASPLASAFDLKVEPAKTTEAAPSYESFNFRFNEMTTDLIFHLPPGTYSLTHPETNPDARAMRGMRGRYDYAFTRDFLAEHFGDEASTDYILLIQMADGHRTTSQYLSDLILGALTKAPYSNQMMKQTPHAGNFMLVNRKTAELDWFFADGRLEGDERTADGARQKLQGVLKHLLRSCPKAKQ